MSQRCLAAMGDRRWKDLLRNHETIADRVVEQYRGRVVKMTGDGVLAIFDGPGRAVRCALALRDAVRTLGIEIRSGLHTGEIELIDGDIGLGTRTRASGEARRRPHALRGLRALCRTLCSWVTTAEASSRSLTRWRSSVHGDAPCRRLEFGRSAW